MMGSSAVPGGSAEACGNDPKRNEAAKNPQIRTNWVIGHLDATRYFNSISNF
jgi:hypothetical protein